MIDMAELSIRIEELSRQYSSLEDEFRQALQIESSRFNQVMSEVSCICLQNYYK